MQLLPNFHVAPTGRYPLTVLIFTAACLAEILNAKEAAATSYLRPVGVEHSGHSLRWHSRRNRRSEQMRGDVICVRWPSTQLSAPIVQLIVPHDTERNWSVVAAISNAAPRYHQSPDALLNTSTFTTPNLAAADQEISCTRHINSSKQSAVLLLTNHSQCEGARILCGELLASQHDGVLEALTATPVIRANTTSNTSSADRFTSLVCSEGYALMSITALSNGSFRYECISVEHSDSNPSTCVPNRIEVLYSLLQCSFYAAVLAVIVTISIIVISIGLLNRGDQQYKQRQFQLTIRLGVFISLLLLFFSEALVAHQTSSSASCYIAKVINCYAIAAFCAWSLLEGYALHQQVVKVFAQPPSHFVAKCVLVGQGLPLIAVSLFILLTFVSSDNAGRERCELSHNGLAKYVIPPIILIVFLVNFMVYLEVVWVLVKLPREGNEKKKTIVRRAKGSLAVFFILGLGWLPTYILTFWNCLGIFGTYICPIVALLAQATIVLAYHISSELSSITKFCHMVRDRLHASHSLSRSSLRTTSACGGSGAPSSSSHSNLAVASSSACECPGRKCPTMSTTSNGVHVTAPNKLIPESASPGRTLLWELSL